MAWHLFGTKPLSEFMDNMNYMRNTLEQAMPILWEMYSPDVTPYALDPTEHYWIASKSGRRFRSYAPENRQQNIMSDDFAAMLQNREQNVRVIRQTLRIGDKIHLYSILSWVWSFTMAQDCRVSLLWVEVRQVSKLTMDFRRILIQILSPEKLTAACPGSCWYFAGISAV